MVGDEVARCEPKRISVVDAGTGVGNRLVDGRAAYAVDEQRVAAVLWRKVEPAGADVEITCGLCMCRTARKRECERCGPRNGQFSFHCVSSDQRRAHYDDCV
eukprot:TRINITY_DN7575_c0_g1_i1.p3 TRINITY_DN7575_c0_g1~~TRINITY_DN7575_c0_g1_i1.p3  ORF type:complete len:102 (+),score=9.80 TRINITY_DN7575_c0_g1_i1:750-1055(+)